MRSMWHGSRRILPILLAIGLIAALAAACGDDSTTSGTSDGAGSPTIEFETPAGSPSAAATSTEAASPSSEASAAPSSEASPEGTTASGPVELTIEAKDTKFDKDTLTVPAGAEVTVKFTNDDKIIHNFSVLTEKDGDSIYEGDLFKGPGVEKDETFTAPAKAGNYYFLCDVHPDEMNGTLVVQ